MKPGRDEKQKFEQVIGLLRAEAGHDWNSRSSVHVRFSRMRRLILAETLWRFALPYDRLDHVAGFDRSVMTGNATLAHHATEFAEHGG